MSQTFKERAMTLSTLSTEVIDLAAEADATVARLEAEVERLKNAESNAAAGWSALLAQNERLASALRSMMDGSVYKSIDGEEPDWHSIQMPRRSALESARIALAARSQEGA